MESDDIAHRLPLETVLGGKILHCFQAACVAHNTSLVSGDESVSLEIQYAPNLEQSTRNWSVSPINRIEAMQMCRKSFQIWDMALSQRLTELKDKRGVSVREIARSLGGVSATTVGRWLEGQGEPSLSQALELASYFQVPLSYLAYDDATTAPSELPEDEMAVLRMYRNLKQRGALDEASATEGLALAAQAAVGRIAKGNVSDADDLPESGFESQQRGSQRARGTRRG